MPKKTTVEEALKDKKNQENLRNFLTVKLGESSMVTKLAGCGVDVKAMSSAFVDMHLGNAREVVEERERQGAAVGLRVCGAQGCMKGGRLRCLGCFFEFYCSSSCQREAWGQHKADCKKARREFKTVVVKKGFCPPFHFTHQQSMNTMTKGHCIVQISEILDKPNYLTWGENWKTGELLVKNEDSTILGNMARDGQEQLFDRIARDCKEKGFKGNVGCYMAIMKSNTSVMEVEVNVERMLPPELWVQPTNQHSQEPVNLTYPATKAD